MMPRRRTTVALFAAAAVVLAGCGGRLQPPMQGQSGAQSIGQSVNPSSSSTVPTFQSSFTLDGTTYTYRIVGSNPALHVATTIPTEIVPVKLVFSDGTAFDPSPVVSGLRTSPVFTSAPFEGGAITTQYGDALMRAEFWNTVRNTSYHVLLGSPHVFPTVSEQVPSTAGRVITVNGTRQGRVTFAWFVDTIEPQLIRQLGIKPTSLAFFSTSNTRVLESTNLNSTATFGGYHDSFHLTTSSGSGIFGTIWGAMFSANTRDVTHVGHEVVEWLNDPFYPSAANRVHHWINPLTNTCNTQGQLEVADPVTTALFTINGYTFEDAVFLSWFSHGAAGINGQYDLINVPQIHKRPSTLC